MRYIEAEVLSEEDGSDTELVARESNNETDEIRDPTPTKKAKVSKRAGLHVADDNKSTCTSSKVEKHKSMKPKTAKKESKEKRKSKQKKKEKKGGLLKGNRQDLFHSAQFYRTFRLKFTKTTKHSTAKE